MNTIEQRLSQFSGIPYPALKNLYYCVYFDNFFTSIPMISKLLEYRIFACGAFRTNKKIYPKNLMKKDNKYASSDIEYAQMLNAMI